MKFHCTLALPQNLSVNQPAFVLLLKNPPKLWNCLGEPVRSHDPAVPGPVQRQNWKMTPVWRSWHCLHARALNDTWIVFTEQVENSGLILADIMFVEGKSGPQQAAKAGKLPTQMLCPAWRHNTSPFPGSCKEHSALVIVHSSTLQASSSPCYNSSQQSKALLHRNTLCSKLLDHFTISHRAPLKINHSSYVTLWLSRVTLPIPQKIRGIPEHFAIS